MHIARLHRAMLHAMEDIKWHIIPKFAVYLHLSLGENYLLAWRIAFAFPSNTSKIIYKYIRTHENYEMHMHNYIAIVCHFSVEIL